MDLLYRHYQFLIKFYHLIPRFFLHSPHVFDSTSWIVTVVDNYLRDVHRANNAKKKLKEIKLSDCFFLGLFAAIGFLSKYLFFYLFISIIFLFIYLIFLKRKKNLILNI